MKRIKRRRARKRHNKDITVYEQYVNEKFKLETKINELVAFLKTDLTHKDLPRINEHLISIKNHYDLSRIEEAVKKAFFKFVPNSFSEDIEITSLEDCVHDLGLCPDKSHFKSILMILVPEAAAPVLKNVTRNQKRNLVKVSSKLTINDDGYSKIKYNHFLTLMSAYLITKLYKPKSEDMLIKAFEKLNQDFGKNSIWLDYERNLVSHGEKFNEEEIYWMKLYLDCDNENDCFDYKTYVSTLVEDHNKYDLRIVYPRRDETEFDILRRFGYV